MADDDRPTGGPPSDDGPRDDLPGDGATGGDDTQQWHPDEEEPAREPGEPDTTQAWEPDATAPLPGGAPEPGQGPDDTAAVPPAWAGRARVPTSGDTGRPDEQWEAVEEPGGPWWLPVALAALALVILGMLAAGVWLIAGALRDEPAPVPAPEAPTESPTSSPTPEAPPQPTPEATGEEASPEPPEPSPSPEPTPTPTPSPEPTLSPTPPGGEE